MLSLLKLVHEWRWLVPTLGIVVPAPAYYCVSLSLRALRPLLGRARVAALDDLAYDSYQSLILLFFETGSGAELRLSGEASDLLGREKTETVILLANHQSTMDWAVADSLAVRAGALGRLRYVLKSSLQYLPLYGWYFWLHGMSFRHRDRSGPSRAQTMLQAASTSDAAAIFAFDGPSDSWPISAHPPVQPPPGSFSSPRAPDSAAAPRWPRVKHSPRPAAFDRSTTSSSRDSKGRRCC